LHLAGFSTDSYYNEWINNNNNNNKKVTKCVHSTTGMVCLSLNKSQQ
jgi:hypothetical protein